MSRIGKKIIQKPQNVEVRVDEGTVIVSGPKGELKQLLPNDFKIEIVNNEITITPIMSLEKLVGLKKKRISSLWGTMRALIANMIKGVVDGFEKKMELHGVGYKAVVEGQKLTLNLGFSHPIEIIIPQGIQCQISKNVIILSGIDKQLIGQVAAGIRKKRKPEPYKGKGIRYVGEIVRKKAGKKVATSGAK